jgi:hypothetical protein
LATVSRSAIVPEGSAARRAPAYRSVPSGAVRFVDPDTRVAGRRVRLYVVAVISPPGVFETMPTPVYAVRAARSAASVGAISAPMIHRNGRKNPIQNSQ